MVIPEQSQTTRSLLSLLTMMPTSQILYLNSQHFILSRPAKHPALTARLYQLRLSFLVTILELPHHIAGMLALPALVW
ncbi:hypothetical protein EB796_023650 [Bugula neritina]|uniref:Uncharacterized protein n=1 Tax=Bugula neritina TaxID=10212 RepID=A0A7J7IWW6_BUGNE|nr:hypothetical protein EB796_023650 [Bugula neritina]